MDCPVQQMSAIGVEERPGGRIGDRNQLGPVGKDATRGGIVACGFGSIAPVKMGATRGLVHQRGREGQVDRNGGATSGGEEQVSTFGLMRAIVDYLFQSNSPASPTKKGGPAVTHRVMAALAGAKRTAVNVMSVRAQVCLTVTEGLGDQQRH